MTATILIINDDDKDVLHTVYNDIYTYIYVHSSDSLSSADDGRLLKIIGLSCKRAL